jgi:hypothetical protein
VKRQQLDEAKAAEEALRKTRDVTQARHDYYQNIAQRLPGEQGQLDELAAAQ